MGDLTVVANVKLDQDYDMVERYLFDAISPAPDQSHFDRHRIVFPTRECSIKLIEHDKTWNSWVHYAVQYPDFSEEHELFLKKLAAGTPTCQIDPAWLGLYFAVLAVRILGSLLSDRSSKNSTGRSIHHG